MSRYTSLSGPLLVLGIALLIAPALFPLQPILYHDTGGGQIANESMLEQREIAVVAYENLSERGQELYVQTLRSGGTYTVPIGTGAPDFAYPTSEELTEAKNYSARNALMTIVIERPPNATLPPADEPVERARFINRRNKEGPNRTVTEIRRQIARYDLMITQTTTPPLTATSSLLRLLSTVLGVVAIGTGGYFSSKP